MRYEIPDDQLDDDEDEDEDPELANDGRYEVGFSDQSSQSAKEETKSAMESGSMASDMD